GSWHPGLTLQARRASFEVALACRRMATKNTKRHENEERKQLAEARLLPGCLLPFSCLFVAILGCCRLHSATSKRASEGWPDPPWRVLKLRWSTGEDRT